MNEPELLTKEELAESLSVKPSTIGRWAREGKIPVINISPKVRRFVYNEVVARLRGARE